jgi:RNA polymerase sigma-B factor
VTDATGDAAGEVEYEQQRDYAHTAPLFGRLAAMAEADPQRRALRDQLVQAYLPVANTIASRFRGRGHSQEDLRQVAAVGLVNAVNRFEPSVGVDFLAFAVPTIMGEVRRYFRDTSWSVRVPRRLKELHLKLSAASGELSQRLGRAPSARELATHLDLPIDTVYEGLEAATAYQAVSLSEPLSSGSDEVPLADALGEDDESFERIDNREAVRPLLEALPERERRILVLRFFGNLSQTQIAEQVGVSQMHVSRLLSRSLNRLRRQLDERP